MTEVKMSLEAELVAKLKVKGIEVAEDMAIVLLGELLDYAEKKVVETENSFDDMILPLLPLIKRELMKLADKIDGKSEEA